MFSLFSGTVLYQLRVAANENSPQISQHIFINTSKLNMFVRISIKVYNISHHLMTLHGRRA